MYDLTIRLEDKPGALAAMGESLGAAGVAILGGGVFVVAGAGHAHFLFQDGGEAQAALESAGIEVLECREVVSLRLKQGMPGQLGKLARMMALAGVNIEVQYSDHANQLILVTDNPLRAAEVAETWSSPADQRCRRSIRVRSTRMNIYHIWCNLDSEAKDVEFADAVSAYLSHLEEEGRIHAWRLSRRKLGLGHPNLPEFHLTIEFESMAQIDEAFDLVSSRSNPIEGLHHAVNSQVADVFFALYRDFPDANRARGDEMF